MSLTDFNSAKVHSNFSARVTLVIAVPATQYLHSVLMNPICRRLCNYLSYNGAVMPVISFKTLGDIFFLFAFVFFVHTKFLAASQFDWKYESNKSKFDDKMSTIAWAYTSNYKYQNNFSIGFKCAGSRLHFEIDVGTFLTGKGEAFEFQYRIDNAKSKTIRMRAFAHSNNGGMTTKDAKKIAMEILGGQGMAVRAIGWSNEFFDAEISLKGAGKAVRRVLSDCLIQIVGEKKTRPDDSYTLNDFLSDFRKLTPKLQQKILKGIKNLMS